MLLLAPSHAFALYQSGVEDLLRKTSVWHSYYMAALPELVFIMEASMLVVWLLLVGWQ